MRRNLFAVAAMAVALLIAGSFMAHSRAVDAASPAKDACDRACLSGFVDQYLAALLIHDSSGLPVASDAKLTENTKPTPLGEGLWKTLKFIKFRGETVSDPSTGQVTYWGAIQEDQVSLLMLRLKIVGGKIAEVETIVAHGSPPDEPRTGFSVIPDLQLLAAIKPFLEDEVSRRASRAQLIAAANAYFDGIEHQPGNVPFAPGCNRIENGQLTTNNPTNSEGLPPLGCQEQFQAKLSPTSRTFATGGSPWLIRTAGWSSPKWSSTFPAARPGSETARRSRLRQQLPTPAITSSTSSSR